MTSKKIIVTLTIKQPDEQFTSEEKMLRWLSSCLNCNVNHAEVEVEKFSYPESNQKKLSKVVEAFDALANHLKELGIMNHKSVSNAVDEVQREIVVASFADMEPPSL